MEVEVSFAIFYMTVQKSFDLSLSLTINHLNNIQGTLKWLLKETQGLTYQMTATILLGMSVWLEGKKEKYNSFEKN